MNWHELSVLVTGGTGSFGRTFVEVVLRELRDVLVHLEPAGHRL